MAEETGKIKIEKKKLRQILAERTKSSASALRQETRKHVVTAVIAAFGFIIALVWKDVIQSYVNLIVQRLTLSGPEHLILFYTALITTIIAVIGIATVNKWGNKPVEGVK